MLGFPGLAVQVDSTIARGENLSIEFCVEFTTEIDMADIFLDNGSPQSL